MLNIKLYYSGKRFTNPEVNSPERQGTYPVCILLRTCRLAADPLAPALLILASIAIRVWCDSRSSGNAQVKTFPCFSI